ncbi:30S ribosomal protein S11 [Candidatus Collierbacteria bacterium]|nr:30S ribosomal protein S11 [Candidatus Collierbacteria bacterium]
MPKKQIKKTNPRPASKVAASGKGRVYITATLNNTLVTVTNEDGNTLCWSSTGTVGFKGSRKSTPYASTMALEAVFKKAQTLGIRQVEVFLKGPGSGRDAALRAFRASPFKVIQIADVTPLPHNGTRKPKVRRG